MSFVLRIVHPVPDYDIWKREGFDRDPIGRAANGVRRYRLLRDPAAPADVTIELEFDTRPAAEAFAVALAGMWGGVRDRFGWDALPEPRLLELTASGEYA